MSQMLLTRNAKWLLLMLILLVAVIFAGCSGKTKTATTGLKAKAQTTSATDTVQSAPASGGSITSGINMELSSTAFSNNGIIPVKYARQGITGGQNISIPLKWSGAPKGTKSFALVMVDTSANNWVHWMVINIPANVNSLSEGASVMQMPGGAKELNNTFGSAGYGGPEPPAGTGQHNYVTTIYALNVEKLSLPAKTSYKEFLRAISGRVLAKASLTGKFSR